jgi:hypothetical protein
MCTPICGTPTRALHTVTMDEFVVRRGLSIFFFTAFCDALDRGEDSELAFAVALRSFVPSLYGPPPSPLEDFVDGIGLFLWVVCGTTFVATLSLLLGGSLRRTVRLGIAVQIPFVVAMFTHAVALWFA